MKSWKMHKKDCTPPVSGEVKHAYTAQEMAVSCIRNLRKHIEDCEERLAFIKEELELARCIAHARKNDPNEHNLRYRLDEERFLVQEQEGLNIIIMQSAAMMIRLGSKGTE